MSDCDYCAVHGLELDADPLRGLVCRACDDEVAASVSGFGRRILAAVRDLFPRRPLLVSLRQTCPSCPSQWEGETADGRTAYIRYRGSKLTVELSAVGQTIADYASVTVHGADDPGCWRLLLEVDTGRGRYDGFMPYGELKARARYVLRFPERHVIDELNESGWL